MDVAAMDLIRLALWVAAALVAAGVCAPMLLAILGFTRVQFRAIAGPEATEAVGEGDPHYLDLYDRLRELGFEPLAVRVERGWFYLWFWLRTSLPGPVFARPGRDCYASLYRLYRGDPWRLAFGTLMTDGTLVSTANQIERLRIERPGYWRHGHVTEDPADLLSIHEETVAGFRVRGWTVATPDLPEYYEVVAQRTEEYLRESGTGKSFLCLQNAFLLMGGGTLMAGLWLGYGYWALPLVPMGCGLIYELLMQGTIRNGADRIHRQEQAFAHARRLAQAGRMAGAEPELRGEEGVLSAEQRRQAAEKIRVNPPPLPPTDLTRPPGS